jgi:pyruvate dehydrogenase (quinone)
MNGMNALITVAKYWERWSDPRLIVCVLNNLDLNQVTWEQRVLNGDPAFAASQEIPDVRYGEYAESLGLGGRRVEDPSGIADAWEYALSADRPVVLDVRTDPDVPPLPPHITLEQARNFTASMLRGDPRAAGVLRQTVKEMVGTLVPGR